MTTVQKIARREVSLLPAVIFSVAALADSFHEAAGPSSLRECAAELASVLGISLFRSHPPLLLASKCSALGPRTRTLTVAKG